MFELARYLKKKRERAGMSQREVAEILGLSTPQLISNVERGACAPPDKKVKKWTLAIGGDIKQVEKMIVKHYRIKYRDLLS